MTTQFAQKWAMLWICLGSSLANAAVVDDVEHDLEHRALLYFVEQTHSVSGLVHDRAHNSGTWPAERGENRMASIAATGFGMAIFANAASRGLMDPKIAEASIARTLKFTRLHLAHFHGWLYHFVDWETGERFGDSEISTIDTAWFLAGAVYASGVFPDSEISRETNEFIQSLDFSDMLTNGGSHGSKTTLSHGWKPESGYLRAQWNTYAEHLLLLILGLGSPSTPLPDIAWIDGTKPFRDAAHMEQIIGGNLPLFVHQYSDLFLDTSYLNGRNPDYFENSKAATVYSRSFCAQQTKYQTYRAGFWGLSAGDSPYGYQAFSPVQHDGTVCPACAGASVMFDRETILNDLASWSRGEYARSIYGRYGFSDSLNVDQNWYDTDVIGITVGALYLSIANTDPSHALIGVFNQIPIVRAGLLRAANIEAKIQ